MQFEKLFSTMKVGTHTYKNRIVAAPIYCGSFINIPGLSDVLLSAMKARAKGGAAQVTIGETAVNFCGASREPFPPIDYTDYSTSAYKQFKELTDYIHENDAVAMIELSHCGNSVETSTGITEAFGPMSFVREDGLTVVAMDESMMQKTTDEFITASKYMQKAGFDGVMIHVGHGWLLHQFLSPRSNQRDDEYGGSLENRARFTLSLLRQIRETMGEDFIIEIRVSGDECAENGMGIDETIQFCKMAEPYIDLIHVSVGDYRNPILSGQFSSLFQPHGLNADMSAAVKAAVSIPVTVVGGINEPAFADELITSNKCDMVAMARQLTADADFPNKAKNGLATDINPCLRCYKCFPGPLEGVLDDLTSLFGCTVNPREFFYDTDFLDKQPAESRNVLIIGGGIGGMQAAITAADRGHQVTLVEKTDRLGGLLNFTDFDYYKKDLWGYKELMIRRIIKRDINVIFNKTVAASDIKSFEADAIIIAVGSSPITPCIDGIENAIRALDVYGNEKDLSDNIVMIGGGLVGCEAGLHLAKLGHKVDIIEMQNTVAPDAYIMHRIALINEMDQMLSYHTGMRCTKINSGSVTATDEHGSTHTFEAESVVYALGMAAHKADADALRAACGTAQVYEIGDCVAPAKVYDACRQAFLAAYSIL